jgi:hypothetical protein
MDAQIFLHVDSKASLEPYESLRDQPNVTILPARHEIFWGGFNTVEAAVSSIQFARNTDHFDRFVFTTEDSIPLVSPGDLNRSFASDIDWIAIHSPNPQWVTERYHKFFYFDSRATSFRYFEAEERCLTERDMLRLGRLRRLMSEGKRELPELFHGCGWWALSEDTVSTILERHHKDRRLRESFEFSAIPEEQYFHTIIGLSDMRRPRQHFMYVDWTRDSEVRPYVFSGLEELKGVRDENPELLFVRKIDLYSAEVEAFIDELLQ